MENKFCNEGNHEVEGRDFYEQGNMCKLCRSEIDRSKREAKTGIELAEYLLHQSCIRALARTRGQGHEKYIGVKCQWSKPRQMKKALMAKKEFWKDWIKQTEIHENSGKLDSTRPTIDRIEEDSAKNGHYYIENIQMLSKTENTKKGTEIKCVIFLIKNLKIIEVSTYESVSKMMERLKIVGHNVVSIKRDMGVVKNIGNGYSLLAQTVNGQLKASASPLYKRVVQKQLIIFDKVTGEEVFVREMQSICETGGIWFDLKVNPS